MTSPTLHKEKKTSKRKMYRESSVENSQFVTLHLFFTCSPFPIPRTIFPILCLSIMHKPLMTHEKLDHFRNCSPEDILALVTVTFFFPQDILLRQYLESLLKEGKTVCYLAAMIRWAVSSSTMVPREMQSWVILTDLQKKDCLVAAGTASGKTLPIVLCILLDDPAANFIMILSLSNTNRHDQ